MFIPSGRLGCISNIASGETWSSETLSKQIQARAAGLRNNGIGPGKRVMLLHGGTPAFFSDLFAIWQLGACAICANPSITDSEVANLVSFASPVLLVNPDATQRANVDCCQIQSEDLVVSGRSERGASSESSSLDDDALILFTSGTTGTPKGVVHSFRSLLARIELNLAYMSIHDMENSLCVLPTHFGHGLIGNCLTPILAGQHLILVNGPLAHIAGRFGDILDKNAVTFFSSVPSFWKLVLKMSQPPQSNNLRRIHVGSAPLSAQQWQEIIDWAGISSVLNMYGITETANWIAGAKPDVQHCQTGDIGHVWGGAVAVLADDGQIKPQGEGEILIQSPSIMTGYFQRPELTSRVLKNGWFYTGDIGFIRADGRISLSGRQKHEINKGGIKIMPEDIDVLLERHEHVDEACAFSIPDELLGEVVGVAVVEKNGENINLGELKTWCRSNLTAEKVPDRWFLVNEIPKTDRGKINRMNVAEICQDLSVSNVEDSL